jgi:hypothetical protein
MWALLGCVGEQDPCAVGARVESVEAALDLVDALPTPVTMDCWLSALERPLGLVLTSDVFNTQPAEGPRSPRIIVRGDDLAITVVPVGEARGLMEFGERGEAGLFVRAELDFPIEERPIDRQYAYDRVLAFPGASESGCRVCHVDEVALGDGRFANNALRPPDELVVPLEVLLDERASCDPAEDPYRCAMFAALVDHGEVYERPFAEEVSTRFGP